MAKSVSLPHSKEGPYKGNYWGILEKDMKLLMREPTLSLMEEIITKYISRNPDTAAIIYSKLENLRKVFRNDCIEALCLVPHHMLF